MSWIIKCPKCNGNLVSTGVVYYTDPLQYECRCTCCENIFKIGESEIKKLVGE